MLKWNNNVRKGRAKHKKIQEDEELRMWGAKKTKQANFQITTPQPNGENYFASSNSTPNRRS